MTIHTKAPRDLREFLAYLRQNKDLAEIEVEVDPKLELAEIHRRVIEEGGKALLFKRVKGSKFPVATNLFGTIQRVNAAFGPDPYRFMKQVAELPHKFLPPSVAKVWNYRELILRLLKVGTKKSSRVPILENVQSPARASELPLLTTWPLDGGPFVTLPLVYTEHPVTKAHNLGMYRIQRYNDAELGLHCQIGKGGGFHLRVAQERREKLPVNVFIGGPPALMLAAIAPLPENVPELLLASFVLGQRLSLTYAPETPLPLCSDAEFTLVGEVDPNEMRPEGPFGDHYGYYSLQHDYPVLRLKSIYHRHDAIYPATVVGKPAQEDYFLGDYLQELLSPLFPLVMPGVEELWSYGDTGFHALASARVKERYKREALGSALRILGEGQLSLTKFLIVVDRPVNLKNFRQLLSFVLERADFRTDLYILGHTSMDTLDYTGPKVNEGSKGILLGCGEKQRQLMHEWRGDSLPQLSDIRVFCPGCLVVEGVSYDTDSSLASQIAKQESFKDWPLVVLVDDAKAIVASERAFLWGVFMRFNPAVDIVPHERLIHQNRVGFITPIVIDARMKPWYPAVVESDSQTAALVDKRWREYFPG